MTVFKTESSLIAPSHNPRHSVVGSPMEGYMKVYTLDRTHVVQGATLEFNPAMQTPKYAKLFLGGKAVPMFKKNPPDICLGSGCMPILMEAHPIRTSKGWTLAKPTHDSNRILVVIRTQDEDAITHAWSFINTMTPEEMYNRTLSQSKRKRSRSSIFTTNFSQREALVMMKPEDLIFVIDLNNQVFVVKNMKKKGLVIIN